MNSSSKALDWKYNGVEYEEALGLDLYEMDFRNYDPAIARWTSIDPVIHYNFSPYNGMDNNPVVGSDPSGADVIEIEGGYKFTGQDAQDLFRALQNSSSNSSSSDSDESDNSENETSTSVTESGNEGNNNTTTNAVSTISLSAQDPCPKCPDKKLRQSAIMMAKHAGGNAQDYYDAMVNDDFVSDKINDNVTWLSAIVTLIYAGPLLKSIFTGGAARITFGQGANQIFHTFRHIEQAGLSRQAVQKAVQESVKQSSKLIVKGKPFNKIITVGGQQIQYTAYKLPSGLINVGRIVIPK
ncbi:RHS repeat-associated core domain-containing protein [Flavivirga sp. 57AJ16]|uniref:RHS repeat-associated core domain-containing protein n=1 Tax=Flavivirga sp. 57AJ16 TaxID=3025307 RepID=UPI0023673679|nr:RHS repeat-associated core domain-containing protein [Flavivirga sp. 57AJ16]MDD7888278.1 hypothetical protein [Flavivirga sp. 57AJ16]